MRMALAAWLLIPLGAPRAIDGYADFESFRKQLEDLKSDRVTLASLGKTLGKRDVFVLTVGTGKADEKPAILIVGSVHAPHLLGSELAVRIARKLAARPELLERATFYVIPRPNPDGSESAFRKPLQEREGNERRTDDDRDGACGEDPADDLNGDGIITMMRVPDESGGFMPHPKDPRVMIAADPKKNEKGSYAMYVEGRDDDHDERYNEDGSGGVSFNRNFTFNYPFFKTGAGPHQVSEVETRAVADFMFAHENIAAVFSFSPEDNLMNPWKGDPQKDKKIKTAPLPGDGAVFEYVAEQYQKIHGGKGAPESPKGEGSFTEWAYYHFGRWSFAARGWWIPNPEAEKKDDERPKKGSEKQDKRGAELLNALRWFEQEKIDGFVPWTAVEHPDFPGKKVEVGGVKPFVLLNPPAKELEPLAEKHFDFVVKLAEYLPQVKIREVKTEKLDGGLFRVTAVVVNAGYFPTVCEMGSAIREFQHLQIKIELPAGASLAAGIARVRLDPIAGGGGKAEPSWLVRAAGGDVKLTVWSPAVGSDSRAVPLEK